MTNPVVANTREHRGAMFVQAARGPVLLITVGILFALHQAGTLSFGRSWPLLIIALGVMKLIERVLGPAPPEVYTPSYGPGAPPRTASPATPPPGGPVR